MYLQGTQKEQPGQRDLLLQFQAQAPDHGDREGQNHKVDEKVRDPVPSVKGHFVNTFTSWCRYVPVRRDGLALKDGGQ